MQKTIKPWGSEFLILKTKRIWIKYILVKERTSLQLHENRTEIHLSFFKFLLVPPRTKHRMTKGNYLEFAWGEPRDEDIQRLEDDYGRIDNPKVVVVSGGFDPVHIGHIRLFREAHKLGDKLVVILNTDEFLKKKKKYIFMSQDERAEVLRSITYVDEVVSCIDTDMTVCKTLELISPDIFANGGDRWENNIPEKQVCEKNGINLVFNVGGGKVQSSSTLVGESLKNLKKEKIFV